MAAVLHARLAAHVNVNRAARVVSRYGQSGVAGAPDRDADMPCVGVKRHYVAARRRTYLVVVSARVGVRPVGRGAAERRPPFHRRAAARDGVALRPVADVVAPGVAVLAVLLGVSVLAETAAVRRRRS